jgi:uroporphyrinogen decarboxylase
MEMTKKERIFTACRNKIPDRIPVSPDISNMVPCRMTGKAFWNVYILNNPPLWKAYADAATYFDFEMWMTYGIVDFVNPITIDTSERIIRFSDHWEKEIVYHTPKGDLTERLFSPADNSPTWVEKVVKSFPEDLPRLKYLFQKPDRADFTVYRQQMDGIGDNGMVAVSITPPGFQNLFRYFNGNIEALTYAYYDYQDEFMELVQIASDCCLRKTELAIEGGVESILTGGSGSITMQSPALFDLFSLPVIREQTRLCRQAGVLSGIHSCGKERHIAEVCARETDLDYINPLEIPPMGDCSLTECKKEYGDKLAIFGNLHTTNVMLNGSPELVKLESLQAILDAGVGGGFVLSTGDQCGRDTPFDNIKAMVNTAKEFGHYPLDTDRIADEIKKLKKEVRA